MITRQFYAINTFQFKKNFSFQLLKKRYRENEIQIQTKASEQNLMLYKGNILALLLKIAFKDELYINN